MNHKPRMTRLIGFGMTLALAGGCGLDSLFMPERLIDGGGGNLITAGLKVVSGQITSLTQDEVQLLADQARTTLGGVSAELAALPEMTNEQADAYLEFLQANGLNSIEAFAAFVENAEVDPDSVVIPESLIEAFADTDVEIDEDNIDVDEVLDLVFAASM